MSLIRWLFTIPIAFFGLYLALAVVLLTHSFIVFLCPTDLVISGQCTASWFVFAVDILYIFGSSLAAIFVVLFPVFVAPNKKIQITKLAYFSGLIAALYIALTISEAIVWWAFLAASLTGLLTMVLITKKIGCINAL